MNYIHISGESNVNHFSFRFNQADLFSDRQAVITDTGNIIINIPIRNFEASNPLMYNDFLSLMKESEHPRIRIILPGDQLNMAQFGTYGSMADIQITIAGITRTYKINCSVFNCAENMFIRGEKRLKLTDFKIDPPIKLKGLVKVNDEIDVDFGFIITFTDTNAISSKL